MARAALTPSSCIVVMRTSHVYRGFFLVNSSVLPHSIIFSSAIDFFTPVYAICIAYLFVFYSGEFTKSNVKVKDKAAMV